MSNATLTINDIILQSLAFLAKDQAENMQFSGLLITEPTKEIASQIQSIDSKKIAWQTVASEDFIKQNFDKRYDLAMMLLSNDADRDAQMIQRCRDLFAKHCLVVQNLSEASDIDMVSFGFSRLHDQPIDENDQNYQVWQFNLFDYKHLPDWFNSKFWANPELWDKFRW